MINFTFQIKRTERLTCTVQAANLVEAEQMALDMPIEDLESKGLDDISYPQLINIQEVE